MLHSVLRAPVRFYDTSPTGRILNRFSTDVDCMDERLPRDLLDVLQRLVFTIIAILLVSLVNYWVAIPALPVVVMICLLCRYYLRTSRETKRLSVITASPVFSHYVETIQGIETIRAHNKEEDFFKQLCRFVVVLLKRTGNRERLRKLTRFALSFVKSFSGFLKHKNKH